MESFSQRFLFESNLHRLSLACASTIRWLVPTVSITFHTLTSFSLDNPDSIQTISTFYSVSIGQPVGKAYQAASLVALARIWLRVRCMSL